jgi:pilus assembly protein CpaF
MSMYSESLRAFLKPVLTYLDDESVSEIMINGPTDIWIERKGRVYKTDARFTEEGLLGAARNMAQFVGRVLSEERPRLDARLPDGSRIHVVLPPIARRGTTISIRKFFKDKLTIDALLQFGTMTGEMARLIDAAIHLKLNMIVSGGTGSGKTTLLNILSSLIPNEERILTIEDSAELQLNQDHLVPFESRPADKFGKGEVNMGDLLHSALRLRPDRIVVGEVRGGEAFYLMQAMNTGHGGSMSTTHANTPTDTLRRLESLCLMSSVDLPMVAVRAQVASAINLIVCCERLHDGSRKVTHVSEVMPLNEKGEYRTQDLFVFTPVTKDAEGHVLGYHGPTGILPTFLGKARAYGYNDLNEAFFDPATYGVPAPPVYNLGEDFTVHWVSSLKHREKGLKDPESFQDQWAAFEAKVKAQGGVKPAAPKPAPPPAPPTSSQAKARVTQAIPAQAPIAPPMTAPAPMPPRAAPPPKVASRVSRAPPPPPPDSESLSPLSHSIEPSTLDPSAEDDEIRSADSDEVEPVEESLAEHEPEPTPVSEQEAWTTPQLPPRKPTATQVPTSRPPVPRRGAADPKVKEERSTDPRPASERLKR